MKKLMFIIALVCVSGLMAQNPHIKTAKEYGFRHLKMFFEGDPVNIIVKSKKGDEHKPKPVFLFIHGSLPMPLILLYNDSIPYGTFPFNTKNLLDKYHLAAISKPYIPLIAPQSKLQKDKTYIDPQTKMFPKKYSQKNYLDYYVRREVEVIKHLKRQIWVSKNKFVLAGHSAGGTIVSKVAASSNDVTHLIVASCNPMGRMMSIIGKERLTESKEKPMDLFDWWKDIVENPELMDASKGDTYKNTYSFSIPPSEYLDKVTIPTLISYGTKDINAPYNDYFRFETIRKKRTNFTFKDYVGLEHNYYGFDEQGKVNFKDRNWTKVVDDWLKWIDEY